MTTLFDIVLHITHCIKLLNSFSLLLKKLLTSACPRFTELQYS